MLSTISQTVVTGESLTAYIDSNENPTDLLTKYWEVEKRYSVLFIVTY